MQMESTFQSVFLGCVGVGDDARSLPRFTGIANTRAAHRFAIFKCSGNIGRTGGQPKKYPISFLKNVTHEYGPWCSGEWGVETLGCRVPECTVPECGPSLPVMWVTLPGDTGEPPPFPGPPRLRPGTRAPSAVSRELPARQWPGGAPICRGPGSACTARSAGGCLGPPAHWAPPFL